MLNTTKTIERLGNMCWLILNPNAFGSMIFVKPIIPVIKARILISLFGFILTHSPNRMRLSIFPSILFILDFPIKRRIAYPLSAIGFDEISLIPTVVIFDELAGNAIDLIVSLWWFSLKVHAITSHKLLHLMADIFDLTNVAQW